MTVAEEISNVQDIVKALLIKYPSNRDSDRKLSANVWQIQLKNSNSITAFEFLKMYCDDKSNLVSQESVGRARRKLQELYPELRGLLYKERQSEQTNVFESVNNIE